MTLCETCISMLATVLERIRIMKADYRMPVSYLGPEESAYVD